MWELHVDHAVSTIVETMLPRFSPRDEGLLVVVTVSLADLERDRSEYRVVHFLFQRPNNYTKVFAAVHQNAIYQGIPTEKWKQYSDHDSGWRSDGFRILNELYKIMHVLLHMEGLPSRHCRIDKIVPVRLELEPYEEPGAFRQRYRPKYLEAK